MLRGGDQLFGELKKLVESLCPCEDEGGRIKHDAVADARGVGVSNKAMVRAIMREGGAEEVMEGGVMEEASML